LLIQSAQANQWDSAGQNAGGYDMKFRGFRWPVNELKRPLLVHSSGSRYAELERNFALQIATPESQSPTPFAFEQVSQTFCIAPARLRIYARLPIRRQPGQRLSHYFQTILQQASPFETMC
jgi:hypothetical protein